MSFNSSTLNAVLVIKKPRDAGMRERVDGVDVTCAVEQFRSPWSIMQAAHDKTVTERDEDYLVTRVYRMRTLKFINWGQGFTVLTNDLDFDDVPLDI